MLWDFYGTKPAKLERDYFNEFYNIRETQACVDTDVPKR